MWQHSSCHFNPKQCISCAGPLTLPLLMAKPAFRGSELLFSLLKQLFCFIVSHSDIASVLQMFGATLRSNAVWSSPWQMVGLCFHSWGSWFQLYCTPLHVKANCGLFFAAKGTVKNTLAISVVALLLAAFNSGSYWSSSMSGSPQIDMWDNTNPKS